MDSYVIDSALYISAILNKEISVVLSSAGFINHLGMAMNSVKHILVLMEIYSSGSQ